MNTNGSKSILKDNELIGKLLWKEINRNLENIWLKEYEFGLPIGCYLPWKLRIDRSR